MMKIIILCVTMLIAINAKGQSIQQACQVKLVAGTSNNTFAAPPSAGKPLRFKLKLIDTILFSDKNGIITISEGLMYSKGNQQVDFLFFDNLDSEYFFKPMFTRNKRTLLDYCGLILVAAPRY